MTGTVARSTGNHYLVLTENGTVEATLKGKVRLEGRKTTNPVAVGDKVDLETDARGSLVIANIHPRKNYIIRKSINLSRQTHILASNVDQAALMVSLVAPRTSLGFIDRFLVTAEAYGIPALLLFNKCDLLEEQGLEVLSHFESIYRNIGYPCYRLSAINPDDVTALKDIFKDKITLVAGHSGTGKSTFINQLNPSLQLKTGDISHVHLKGMHTTTFAELLPLPFGGYVIDSPGIKELGLVEMKKEEVGHYFPEIRERMNDCKFNNCIHVNEPGCAVVRAVEEGEISPERYNSYVNILHGEEMDWKEWET